METSPCDKEEVVLDQQGTASEGEAAEIDSNRDIGAQLRSPSWEEELEKKECSEELVAMEDEERRSEESKTRSEATQDEEKYKEGDPLVREGWTDVLETKQLYKMTTRDGNKEPGMPYKGQEVTIRIRESLPDGGVVFSDEEFTFILGDDDVVQAVDMCVQLMYLGEIVRIKTTARFAHGSFGKPPDVPPNSSMEYEVELLQMHRGISLKTVAIPEKLVYCEGKRERGNYFYNRQEYELAADVYKKAKFQLDRAMEDASEGKAELPQEQVRQLEECRAKIANNLAVVYLKQDLFKESEECAEVCLAVNPTNSKALYRLGKAQLGRGQYKKALESFNKVRQLEPDLARVRKDIEHVKSLIHKMKKERSELYKRMVQQVIQPEPPTWQSKLAWLKIPGWSIAVSVGLVSLIWSAIHFFKDTPGQHSDL